MLAAAPFRCRVETAARDTYALLAGGRFAAPSRRVLIARHFPDRPEPVTGPQARWPGPCKLSRVTVTRKPERMLRVMLVDDSDEDVSLLKDGLAAAGYDVVVVSTLGLALAERVAEFLPDVIIIDTESPTRDVLEHVSVVSAHNPRPIVLFTEDRDERDDPGRAQGRRVGLCRGRNAGRSPAADPRRRRCPLRAGAALREEFAPRRRSSSSARWSSGPRAS